MKIAFPFAGEIPASIAGVMIDSCRRVMPGVPIYQLTDLKTQALPNAIPVRKNFQDIGELILNHFLDLEGEVLKLDYDMIVQRDVSEVFRLPFDFALTRRPLNDLTISSNIRVRNPYNHGVMFLRNSKEFFRLALKEYMDSGRHWMNIPVALDTAAAMTTLKWVELPGERYNYTPKLRDEDVSHCSIVHYKGARKWWMVETEEAKRAGDHVANELVYEHEGETQGF